jgi:hypothetical protein
VGTLLQLPFQGAMLATGGIVFEGLEAAASANALSKSNVIYVIGRQVDTAIAKNWAGHTVLDIANWTILKNDAWVAQAISQDATVYLASPQTEATLWDLAANRTTVFGRELQQFFDAGYKQVGDYLIPGK